MTTSIRLSQVIPDSSFSMMPQDSIRAASSQIDFATVLTRNSYTGAHRQEEKTSPKPSRHEDQREGEPIKTTQTQNSEKIENRITAEFDISNDQNANLDIPSDGATEVQSNLGAIPTIQILFDAEEEKSLEACTVNTVIAAESDHTEIVAGGIEINTSFDTRDVSLDITEVNTNTTSLETKNTKPIAMPIIIDGLVSLQVEEVDTGSEQTTIAIDTEVEVIYGSEIEVAETNHNFGIDQSSKIEPDMRMYIRQDNTKAEEMVARNDSGSVEPQATVITAEAGNMSDEFNSEDKLEAAFVSRSEFNEEEEIVIEREDDTSTVSLSEAPIEKRVDSVSDTQVETIAPEIASKEKQKYKQELPTIDENEIFDPEGSEEIVIAENESELGSSTDNRRERKGVEVTASDSRPKFVKKEEAEVNLDLPEAEFLEMDAPQFKSAGVIDAHEVRASELDLTPNLNLGDLSGSSKLKYAPVSIKESVETVERPVSDQISISLRQSIHSGRERMQVTLTPEHLGRVDIELNIHNGSLKDIKIFAHKAETLDAIIKDSQILKQAVNSIAKDADVYLSFNLRDESSNTGYESQNDSAATLASASEYTIVKELDSKAQRHIISDDRVDISI